MRFIPTGVGNASASLHTLVQVAVHPHGCGERLPAHTGAGKIDGSSPRVWGTQEEQTATCRGCAVHPHGCGERYEIDGTKYAHAGSSPRVWGTHGNIPFFVAGGRFIPTGVGNACMPKRARYLITVHPHGCGERDLANVNQRLDSGSSPRVWGTPTMVATVTKKSRFIPTGVGNASFGWGDANPVSVHPHGCGERNSHSLKTTCIAGSSPRVWGTPGRLILSRLAGRFIPTGVGNAVSVSVAGRCPTVHPHGCGERCQS